MNREETIEAIKVMQAFVDGKTVQYKSSNSGWKSAGTPVWNFIEYSYRVKPEPIELWIPSYTDICNGFDSYQTKEQCDNEYRQCANYKKAIKLVEVTE